jgi:hypothetical protein
MNKQNTSIKRGQLQPLFANFDNVNTNSPLKNSRRTLFRNGAYGAILLALKQGKGILYRLLELFPTSLGTT